MTRLGEVRLGVFFWDSKGEMLQVDQWNIHDIVNETQSISFIHLSHEWLLRFRFEYNTLTHVNDEKRLLKKYSSSSVYFHGIPNANIHLRPKLVDTELKYVLYYKTTRIEKPIKYVHELQNIIFTLTGEELSI